MKRSEDEMTFQNVQKLIQEKLKEVDPKLMEDLMSQMKSKSVKPKIQARSTPKDFEKFIGFWQSTSAIDFNTALMEFYLDKAKREIIQKVSSGVRFDGDKVDLLSPDFRVISQDFS